MDTGSPIVCESNSGRHELSGMLTTVNVCARDTRPKVITNVAKHLKWIKKKYGKKTKAKET